MSPSASTCCAPAMHQMALQGGTAGAERLLAQAEAVAAARPTVRSQALVQAGRAVLSGVARRCRRPACGRPRREALRAAEAVGDPTLVVAALHSVFRSTLELGDLAGLDAARQRLAAVATESLFPFAIVRVGLLDVSLALARGELDGLEERIAAVEATGRAIGVVSWAGRPAPSAACSRWSEASSRPWPCWPSAAARQRRRGGPWRRVAVPRPAGHSPTPWSSPARCWRRRSRRR